MIHPYTSERGMVMGVNIDRNNIKFKFYLSSDQPHPDNDSYNLIRALLLLHYYFSLSCPVLNWCKYSVPLFGKEGLGAILLRNPPQPSLYMDVLASAALGRSRLRPFSKGEVKKGILSQSL